MGTDPEEEEEEEAVATSEEEQEEDVSEDDEGEDEEAGPSGRDSDAPDALPSDVDETENEEDEEYQEDETDEEMFDETHTVDDVLRSVNDERADGPAPYEILAQRKREANEKNEAAFRAELRSLGVNEREVEGLEGFGGKDKGKGGKGGARVGGGGKNAGKGRNRYRASELLERHNIDKEEVIKKTRRSRRSWAPPSKRARSGTSRAGTARAAAGRRTPVERVGGWCWTRLRRNSARRTRCTLGGPRSGRGRWSFCWR